MEFADIDRLETNAKMFKKTKKKKGQPKVLPLSLYMELPIHPDKINV